MNVYIQERSYSRIVSFNHTFNDIIVGRGYHYVDKVYAFVKKWNTMQKKHEKRRLNL